MKAQKDLIVAITGASGALYARLLVGKLLEGTGVGRVAVIFSHSGRQVAAFEKQEPVLTDPRVTVYDNGDLFASPASGSAGFDAMAVVPCSVGTLGRIASGVSADLIGRAADVMLKERRPLVLAVRETPLNLIHIRNMEAVTLAGGMILPASPSFYSFPQTIDQAAMTVVDRIAAHMGVEISSYRWDGGK